MDTASQNNVATYFRTLHEPGKPLILTNVWDAGTAKLAAANPHTKAIATASYAIAASAYGIPDDDMTLAQNLAVVKNIAAVVHPAGLLPLTVDVQDGYASVAESIEAIIRLGAVGCNLEDVDCKAGTLRPLDDAVARVREAVQAAKDAGVPDFAVNARTDALCFGQPLTTAIERGKAYLDAGAHTVFVWGGPSGRGVSMDEVSQLVDAFAGRLNVKMVLKPSFAEIPEISRAGVARISVGPELYHRAMAAYKETVAGLIGTRERIEIR